MKFKTFRSNLTREEKNALALDLPRLHNAEIAKKYGISVSTVTYYRTRFKKPAPKKDFSQFEDEVCSLYQQKFTVHQIQIRTGISLHSIQRILARRGFGFKDPNDRIYYITPENAPPALYDGKPDSYDLEPAERKRFEQLKSWKMAKYLENLKKYEESIPEEEDCDDE